MKKHRFPKPFPVMLSAVLCLAGVPFGGISAQAADSVQQVNNIVLFAQFASADTDNFMADKTEDMVAMCNSTDTYRSLAKYMDTISYGKVHVTSYFPQMQDGVIQPYVLKRLAIPTTTSMPWKWYRISPFLRTRPWTETKTV